MANFNIGVDKVAQIYPDAKGGSQVYMKDSPDTKTFNVSYGGGSHIPYSKQTEGSLTFFNTEGSPINYASGSAPGRSVRIDTYPGGGMWANKTNYSYKNNPGYLYNEQGIKNGEFTTFIRVHGDLGTHQAYAHKIGGRDEDALRSLMEMVWPTAGKKDITINYNFAHFPYVKASATSIKKAPVLEADKWVAVKTIHIVAPDNKSTHWEMWADIDPITPDGKINNNWEKYAEYEDHGTDAYGNIPVTWKCHKDVCRVDGFENVDFALFSDREIDPSGTATTVGTGAGTEGTGDAGKVTPPTPQPKPKPDPAPIDLPPQPIIVGPAPDEEAEAKDAIAKAKTAFEAWVAAQSDAVKKQIEAATGDADDDKTKPAVIDAKPGAGAGAGAGTTDNKEAVDDSSIAAINAT